MSKRRIIVRSGPGPQLLLAVEPKFPVGRPIVCGSRADILELAETLSDITGWQVVNEVDTLQ